MKDHLDFSSRLKEARKLCGITQDQLAAKAGFKSSTVVSHYETGERKPDINNLVRLADALGVSTDYLVGREDLDPLSGISPVQLERIALFVKETGEASKEIGKALRFGFESRFPADGPTNRQRLSREVGDILEVIDLILEAGDLDNEAVEAARIEKREKWKKWLNHNKVGQNE